MTNLIIDAATDKIFFKIIIDGKSYTSDHPNSRENFEKLTMLLFNFLGENSIKAEEINNIFINQGPGKFSGIRSSIAVAKALNFTNESSIYGFDAQDAKDQKYDKILDLFNKGLLTKNLIKPHYSS